MTLTRRDLLRLGAAAGGLAVAAPMLGACGGEEASRAASSGPAGDEARASSPGGRLRLGAIGAPTDNLNPVTVQGNADYLAIAHIWDSLTLLKGGDVVLSLAESIEPDAGATTWTIRLREGVTFHDGKPVRAADAVFSLRALAVSPFFGQFLADIDARRLRALDARTVEVPLTRPRADLVEGALSIGIVVFPEGMTDFTKGNGSGPFRLARYEQGRSTVLQRNPDYWGDAARLDEVEIFTIADPAARLAGVRSGELDFAARVSAAGARAAKGDDLRIVRGGVASSDAFSFLMNVKKPPFDDPSVRVACKLACDRKALVDTVFLGEGRVGNDLLGLGLAGYDAGIPQRGHDPERAAQLFAKAGVTTLAMRVADLAPGVVSAGEIFVEQLAAAGVKLTLEKADAPSYFNDYPALLSTPFQGFYFINRTVAAALPFLSGSRSTFNLTGFAPPEHDRLLESAQSNLNADQRRARFAQAQRLLWEEGGELIWGYQEVLHATSAKVNNVELSQSFPLLNKVSLR